MTVLDFSDVTRAIKAVIIGGFATSAAWQDSSGNQLLPPGVYPEPPQKLTTDGLGIYLYHVRENPQYKNIVPPGNDQPPIQNMPLALDLYYQLTANQTEGDDAAFTEQLLMSIAMKALHDYPIVDDSTAIAGQSTFGGTSLTGNGVRLRISLQPILYNEAVNYWTAGTYPIKLAAYYEVSVILFEPVVPKTYAGRVLTYGTFVFTEGAPTITSAMNTISFSIPGVPGVQTINIQPAQVTQGKTFTVTGSRFDGDKLQLYIISSIWSEPATPDATWTVIRQAPDMLVITVGTTVWLPVSATTKNVIPGLFSVMVSVIRSQLLPNNQLKSFVYNSNQFPFSITPNIAPVGSVPAGTVFAVNGFLFQDPLIAADAIQVIIGNSLITPVTSAPTAGQFQVTGPNAMQVGLPATAVAGNVLPLRITVAGAESAPVWIKIT